MDFGGGQDVMGDFQLAIQIHMMHFIYIHVLPSSAVRYRLQYRSVTTYTSTFGCCSGYYQSGVTCQRKC